MSTKKEEPKIITVPCRLSFPDLIKPKSFQGGPAKYGAQLIFYNSGVPFKQENGAPWTGHDLKALKKLAAQVRDEKWGADKTKHPKNLKSPFVDGNEKDLDSHKDAWCFNAKSNFAIPAVDQNREEILDMKELYAGCWVRARLSCYAFEIKEGKSIISAGVAFGLNSLQKVRDDKPFSGRGNAKDDFDAIELDNAEFDESNGEDEDDF